MMQSGFQPRLTYLAAPFRHAVKSVRNSRLEAVSRYAALLTDIDRRVFCPLAYAQALIDHGFGYKDDEWWYKYDVGWLEHCDELIVLMLPGWSESKGVRIEIEAAEELGILVSYADIPEAFAGLSADQSEELHRRLSV